jgi:hypothetical protein
MDRFVKLELLERFGRAKVVVRGIDTKIDIQDKWTVVREKLVKGVYSGEPGTLFEPSYSLKKVNKVEMHLAFKYVAASTYVDDLLRLLSMVFPPEYICFKPVFRYAEGVRVFGQYDGLNVLIDYVIQHLQSRGASYITENWMVFSRMQPRLNLREIMLKVAPSCARGMDGPDAVLCMKEVIMSEIDAIKFIKYNKPFLLTFKRMVFHIGIMEAVRSNWGGVLYSMNQKEAKQCALFFDGRAIACDVLSLKHQPVPVREMMEYRNAILYACTQVGESRRAVLSRLLCIAVSQCIVQSSKYFGRKADARFWNEHVMRAVRQRNLSDDELKGADVDIEVIDITEKDRTEETFVRVKSSRSKDFDFWSFAITSLATIRAIHESRVFFGSQGSETFEHISQDLTAYVSVLQELIYNSHWNGWTTHLSAEHLLLNIPVHMRNEGGWVALDNKEFRRICGYDERVESTFVNVDCFAVGEIEDVLPIAAEVERLKLGLGGPVSRNMTPKELVRVEVALEKKSFKIRGKLVHHHKYVHQPGFFEDHLIHALSMGQLVAFVMDAIKISDDQLCYAITALFEHYGLPVGDVFILHRQPLKFSHTSLAINVEVEGIPKFHVSLIRYRKALSILKGSFYIEKKADFINRSEYEGAPTKQIPF